MRKGITNYQEYVKYLDVWIHDRPRKGRGIKTQMAKYIGCYPIHITKILNRTAHLTMEQSAKIINFLELSKLEGQYFLCLVELARAGNNELRETIKDRMEEITEKWKYVPSSYIGEKLVLSREDYEILYESWIYLAIELLATIPKFQQIDSICDYLHLPKKEVLKVLNFLVEKELVKKEGDRYIRDLKISLEMPPADIYRAKHHINWRNRAIGSLDQKEENNLNSTIVMSLSEKDVPRIMELIDKTSADIVKSVEDSPREELRCLCIDFFKVK